LIFLAWSSSTAHRSCSASMSNSSSTRASTSAGQAVTQSPQPSHLSVSIVMKKSPEPSL
jgi:hypothetical protein